jgi:hypothetical protein
MKISSLFEIPNGRPYGNTPTPSISNLWKLLAAKNLLNLLRFGKYKQTKHHTPDFRAFGTSLCLGLPPVRKSYFLADLFLKQDEL